MANPQVPGGASPNTPPPVFNLPIGQISMDGRDIMPSAPFVQFLQELWAGVFGGGGVVDIATLGAASAPVSQAISAGADARGDSLALGTPFGAGADPLLGLALALTLPNTAAPPEPLTWTPVVQGSGTAGTQTYATQLGQIVYIGPLAFATFDIVLSAFDAATAGSVQIAGLPVPGALTPGLRQVGVMSFGNVVVSAGYTVLDGEIAAGSSVIAINQNANGAGAAVLALPAAALSATSRFTGGILFFH